MDSMQSNKRDRLALLLVFALALGLRLLYIHDVSDQPFFGQVIIDQASYDKWAQEIAAGDWLGERPFYQAPLYPYFLAVVYSLFGRSLVLVYVIQAMLSSACCLPLYGMGRRIFQDPRVGLLAALFWAVYKVDFFYVAQLLKTGPGICLVILALWLLLVLRDRPRTGVAIACGLACGLLPLFRGNFLAVVPALFLWLCFVLYRRLSRAALKPLVVYALSCAFVLVLTAARNYAVSGELVLTTAQAGINFYLGNFSGNRWGAATDPPFARRFPGLEQVDFAAEAKRRTGQSLSPSELSRFWYKEAMREMAENPRLSLLRLGRKALLAINRHEASDNLNYDFFRERFSWVLRLPLPGFWLAGSLGVAGLVLGVWRRRGGLLIVYLASYLATLLVFYILGRYRMPLVPPLLVFAGYGMVSAGEAWKKRDKKTLAVLLAALVVGGALSYPRWRPSRYDHAWYKLGNAFAREGRWTEAMDAYQRSLAINPELIQSWIGMGAALENRNRWEEAARALQRAVEIEPDHAGAHYLLGKVFSNQGLYEKARMEYERALELDPSFARARQALKVMEGESR